MKKTLVAMAVLGAIAGAAQAQSSVTLYGRIDENFGSFTTNANIGTAAAPVFRGVTTTKISDGGFNGSRFGLKGSEDLGNGLSAIFNLEAGVNADAGSSTQGSTLFGRRSIVGISSSSWGTLGFGRNSSSYDDVAGDHAMMEASMFDPSNTNNAPQAITTAKAGAVAFAAAKPTALQVDAVGGDAAVAAALLTRQNTTWVGYSTRFNNSIKYQSPSFGGFSGGFTYALGEDNKAGSSGTAVVTDATSTIAANLKYVGGPLVVSLGYQSEALGGTQATTSSGTSGIGANPNSASNATTVLKPALENTIVSASYDFGVAKVGVGYNTANFKDITLTAQGQSLGLKQNEYNLSVAVPFGATTLSAGYAVSQGDTLGKATGYGLQAKYAVSKRTFVYGGYQNTSTYDNLVTYANTYFTGSQVQDKLSSYAVGIQHQF